MTHWGDDFDDWEEGEPVEPPAVEVDITDPTVVGELLGPDGEPIAYLLSRAAVPFGYQPPRRP